ncbi:sigma factor-like helix-turn-helix DNA-binding protein [Kitasatospora sp. GP82]|uniref:RNA polymerase sigma factor n=1 Tax=Kitasatospora sp. GP82 TaxID=3035089 RepID=UPI0024744B2B|nr:sigma factor-like helix-turn-helix DNA-binding protein [Kitasatospora sp. GP82]MDH6129761.1 DNA-directed RNA polymerase specialized sigma24 family protein [Kitasatospora sp. GP82]
MREAVRVARRSAVERTVDPEDFVGLPGLVGDGEPSAQVRDVLARVPVHHRAVLVLRELEELDERSAAEILGTAPGTVKSRLHRARSAFRKAWQQ